jgi:hypothetical protein
MCASVGNSLTARTKGVVASKTIRGSTSSGKTTSTSASKATPAKGSVTGTTATSTSSSAKATSSSDGSSLVNKIKGSLVAQVSSLRSLYLEFANKTFLSLLLDLAGVVKSRWYLKSEFQLILVLMRSQLLYYLLIINNQANGSQTCWCMIRGALLS